MNCLSKPSGPVSRQTLLLRQPTNSAASAQGSALFFVFFVRIFQCRHLGTSSLSIHSPCRAKTPITGQSRLAETTGLPESPVVVPGAGARSMSDQRTLWVQLKPSPLLR